MFMKIKTKPEEIFSEYEAGKEWNQNHDLYENVEKNRRFEIGDQWHGVNAPNMVKPVFNVIKRVTSYFVATIVSNNVGVHITPFDEDDENLATAEIMANEVNRVLERTKMNAKTRTFVRNACIDGDTDAYVLFDPDIETNQSAQGDIDIEIVENTHIIFGNPYSCEVQKQPYILVIQRKYVDSVKDEAPKPEEIVADEDYQAEYNTSGDSKLVTVITKFWKVKTTETVEDDLGKKEVSHTDVWYTKVTANSVLKEPTKLGYHMFPIAHMSWEKVKNSYHGQSPITGLIPNQIFINKIYAMCMVYMTNMGFPKIFYDQNKIAAMTNDVTKATAITNMDLAGKVMDAVKAPDFSNQVIQLIDSTIQYTKELMGASDSALGELTNPNNTSAIVAVQQASSVPLEIQKLDFQQFYEDVVRIIIDIMATDYGRRLVKMTEIQSKALGNQPTYDEDGVEHYPTSMMMDFSIFHNMNYDLSVEVGQSSYWSETTQVQTADSMFDRGIITDPLMYLDLIPEKYIPGKAKLIDKIKEQQAEAQRMEQMQMMQEQGMTPPQPQGEEVPEGTTWGMRDGQDNRAPAGMYGNEQLNEVYAEAKEDFYQ